MKTVRQSIVPTYDSRHTGPRYTVATYVGRRRIDEHRIDDPFVHTRVIIGWRDLLRGLLRRHVEVEVVVSGDRDVVEDVMELDDNYLGANCTRREQFGGQIDAALRKFGDDGD